MKTTINLRIDSEIKNQLEFLSQKRGVTTSNLLREIINEFLKFNFPIEDYEDDDDDSVLIDVITMDLSDLSFINGNVKNNISK
ncbi:hypothetical protein FG167_08760 [Lacinutrix sp. WUR7]|uniref:ribbon-helix-helix domain-containing protein n=1 Tax=Lacinutrix sp. WUR7 TaxID=2653681 RepID=UPI00193E0C09|nr:CopG family transcriptional regulator [Lacinutrix sp. WUR7]QRM89320.1 hypothetical protein FG167_08760 [Lacinutrix sp. WUR7]